MICTPARPGVFLNAMIIARIPLFFFQAVKASLLPSLADLAGRGELAGFRNMQIKIVAAVSALASVSVLVAAWVGPEIVSALFADEVSRRDMALLAASGGGLMLMLSLALGLVALGHSRLAVTGWVVGLVAFASTVVFDLEPFLRVELALVAAVLAGSATVGVLLRLEYAAHTRGSLRPIPRNPPRRRPGAGSRTQPSDSPRSSVTPAKARSHPWRTSSACLRK